MIDLTVDAGVGTILLNRPGKLNAFTFDMWRQLDGHLSAIENDRFIRSVVLTGAGRGFCAGADVVSADHGYATPTGPADVLEEMRIIQGVVLRLHNLDKPVVAAVRGPAVGIGWTLALAADMVVASETAKFCAIFLERALVPECGTLPLLVRQIGHYRAREIVYSRRFVQADEALAMGLVNTVVADDALATHAAAVAAGLAKGPGFAVAMTKRLFNQLDPLETALAAEALAVPAAFGADDRREVIEALREDRPPAFTGR